MGFEIYAVLINAYWRRKYFQVKEVGCTKYCVTFQDEGNLRNVARQTEKNTCADHR